ncbi:hypothetical protein OOT46_29180 [Aquabacterium sp. A7-Y]|uniref:hypothetical protein n=1 Tax=Aquabacterium sp. A7-Y TaxID=1349605 RepID=UPI00223E0D4F|nr:hypothetical protein [Aquabacterium sp. A7-Y]MCW7541875.1 hypothetical protein [Aquabacterium sp. A7-Y]
MAIELNNDGTWTKGCVPSVRAQGAWREAKGLWRNEGGAWRQIYERFESTIVPASSGGPAGGNKRVDVWGTTPVFKGASISALQFTLGSFTTTLRLAGQWPESFITQIVMQDNYGNISARWRKDASYSFDGTTSSWSWTSGVAWPDVGASGYVWLKG